MKETQKIWHIGRTSIFLVFAVLLTWAVIVPVVAEDTSTLFTHQENIVGVTVPAPIPVDMDQSLLHLSSIEDSDDGLWIRDMEGFLSYWNERLNWQFSEIQIQEYTEDVCTRLSSVQDTQSGFYDIDSIDDLGTLLGSVLGLTQIQIETFVTEERNQLQMDRIAFHQASSVNSGLSSETGIGTRTNYPPSLSSAPYAIGKLMYAYIFVNFESPSSYGNWTDADMSDAISDANQGLVRITTQAPSSADVSHSAAYYGPILVSGANTGLSSATGNNGWMERAAMAIGYTDSNNNGIYTDDMASALKAACDADSIILIFFTHDAEGAYAIGYEGYTNNRGYADRVAVSYKGAGVDENGQPTDFESVPGSYLHEVLHAYGAAGEYIGESTHGAISTMAVSPMRELYTNTNHETSPSHTHSVMCGELYNSDPSIALYISTSSGNFIGWGDWDNDGILDPLDPTPQG